MKKEDRDKLTTFLNDVREAKSQRIEDFDQLWLQATKHIKSRIARDMAFEWFCIGYDLAEHRKSKDSPASGEGEA